MPTTVDLQAGSGGLAPVLSGFVLSFSGTGDQALGLHVLYKRSLGQGMVKVTVALARSSLRILASPFFLSSGSYRADHPPLSLKT